MQPITCTNSVITDCDVDIKCVTESVRRGVGELHIGPIAVIADRHQLERVADVICAWLIRVPEVPDNDGPTVLSGERVGAPCPNGYDGH